MLKKLNKFATLVLSFALAVVISLGFVIGTSASSAHTVAITKEGQVVDTITLAGTKVEARYGFTGKYQCAELVMRFYQSVFGEQVNNLYSNYSTPMGTKARFVQTTKPVVGDIVRFADRTHWALVKAVDGKTVTIIEQNWSYYSGGHKVCPVNRTIAVGSGYTIFHYKGYEKALRKIERAKLSTRLTKVEDNEKLQELGLVTETGIPVHEALSADSVILNVLGQ